MEREQVALESRILTMNIIDDGFSLDLVKNARFEGLYDIPAIERPDKLVIPSGMVPFSRRNESAARDKFVCFYEYDRRFAYCLTSTQKHRNDLKRFPGIISPDCSLYIDMPLILQIANVYLSRAIGAYFQRHGAYVIPNVRWGDERTYTTETLPEKVAFLGLPKHSILSVGTYGCVKSKEAKYYFREGLQAMLEELEPEIVLVYGSMPKNVFNGLENRTRFVQYLDWIKYRKTWGENGGRQIQEYKAKDSEHIY